MLELLDCPSCQQNRGLSPQELDGAIYLACPLCESWYPVQDGIPRLLMSSPEAPGLRRPLDRPTNFRWEVEPLRAVDMKAAVYSYTARMAEFVREYRIDEEPFILDVGCSTGSFAACVRRDQTYIGLDLSFDSLRFARRATGRLYVQADAQRLPFKADSCPFFISRELLEHIGSPPAAARELLRVSRRGVLVVPTCDFPVLYDPVNWTLRRFDKSLTFGAYGYGHRQLLGISAWRELLEANGFRVLRERSIGTGLLLNASDVFWHCLYSWRDFDRLPRRAVPIWVAKIAMRVNSAVHRLDAPLYRAALSQAFELQRS